MSGPHTLSIVIPAYDEPAAISSLLGVTAVMLGITTLLLHMMDLIDAQRSGAVNAGPPDRVREPRPPEA